MGSKFLYSPTYHRKMSGQIDVVKQGLGNLLRSLSGEKPRQ
jgi:hypothetical protein